MSNWIILFIVETEKELPWQSMFLPTSENIKESLLVASSLYYRDLDQIKIC